jgi:hypothetical protein
MGSSYDGSGGEGIVSFEGEGITWLEEEGREGLKKEKEEEERDEERGGVMDSLLRFVIATKENIEPKPISECNDIVPRISLANFLHILVLVNQVKLTSSS